MFLAKDHNTVYVKTCRSKKYMIEKETKQLLNDISFDFHVNPSLNVSMNNKINFKFSILNFNKPPS